MSKKAQKHDKNKSQLFLAHLLKFLASRPCFYLVAIGLMIGLAIGSAVLIALEIVVVLSRWSL